MMILELRRQGLMVAVTSMGFAGMARAFAKLASSAEGDRLTHPEWLGLLLDREWSFSTRPQTCGPPALCQTPSASTPKRMSTIAVIGVWIVPGSMKLVAGDWIGKHDSLINMRPTGVSKSCSPARSATRLAAMIAPSCTSASLSCLPVLRDGRHPSLQRTLGSVQLLILDNLGFEPLNALAHHDLLEILEERYGGRSTIITSQLPVASWHEMIGDPTYADANLDRLVHNAHRLNLEGYSMHRLKTDLAA